MKQLVDYIFETQYNNLIIEAAKHIIADDMMVTESFKSSIVQKLAKAIYDAEKDNNIRKVKDAQRMDKEYPSYDGSKRDPHLTNFASIFGPKTTGTRYSKKTGLQGLKWSEITDDDLKVYKPTDKELIKLVKKTYGKPDGNADFIITNKDDKVLNFIKAYGVSPKEDSVYYFKYDGYGERGQYGKGVKEMTADKYKYQTRNLKTSEVIELLNVVDQTITDAKVYVLEVTPDMVKDYNILHNDRLDSQKGIINYDQASLDELLKQQKARYRVMVDEIKAQKLQSDPNDLLKEIKKVNDEVIELYQVIISKPQYIDQYFDLGGLLSYVSNAYEYLYKSIKETREGDRAEQRAKNKNADDPKSWRQYSDERSQEYIVEADTYLKKVRKMIDEIKDQLN